MFLFEHTCQSYNWLYFDYYSQLNEPNSFYTISSFQFSSKNTVIFTSYQILHSCWQFKHIVLWFFISITTLYIYTFMQLLLLLLIVNISYRYWLVLVHYYWYYYFIYWALLLYLLLLCRAFVLLIRVFFFFNLFIQVKFVYVGLPSFFSSFLPVPITIFPYIVITTIIILCFDI